MDQTGVLNSPVTMQCMEVWGGNRATDSGVVMPGLDAWVYARPYGEHDEGGDIHYVSSCATGSITRMLVADVAGHGAGVGEIATKLRALMRRYVNFVDQTEVARGLNTEFGALSKDGGFATAVLATYFAPRSALTITSAGHPRPLVYRERARAWEALDFHPASRDRSGELSNIPLGIAAPTRYDEVSFQLAAGDLVLMYTDALMEARAGPGGRQLGTAGLAELLGTLDPEPHHTLVPRLLALIYERTAGAPIADDVTALLIRPNAVRARSSVGVLVRGLVDRTRRFVGV